MNFFNLISLLPLINIGISLLCPNTTFITVWLACVHQYRGGLIAIPSTVRPGYPDLTVYLNQRY